MAAVAAGRSMERPYRALSLSFFYLMHRKYDMSRKNQARGLGFVRCGEDEILCKQSAKAMTNSTRSHLALLNEKTKPGGLVLFVAERTRFFASKALKR